MSVGQFKSYVLQFFLALICVKVINSDEFSTSNSPE